MTDSHMLYIQIGCVIILFISFRAINQKPLTFGEKIFAVAIAIFAGVGVRFIWQLSEFGIEVDISKPKSLLAIPLVAFSIISLGLVVWSAGEALYRTFGRREE